MATLTVRLPATAADRATRHAAWGRRAGADAARATPLPRRATPVWSDLYTLQPPACETAITLEAVAPAKAPLRAADDDRGGWFDSTWELQQGLDVAEGLPADVPLEAWLQVYLNA